MKQSRQSRQRRQEGQYSGSLKRWWLSKQQSPSLEEPAAFQRYQFDSKMGGRPSYDELPPSPRAYAEHYSDNSLDYHVEKLLRGIHDIIHPVSQR